MCRQSARPSASRTIPARRRANVRGSDPFKFRPFELGDELDLVELVVEVELEHHAVDAGVGEGAEAVEGLVGGAGDPWTGCGLRELGVGRAARGAG